MSHVHTPYVTPRFFRLFARFLMLCCAASLIGCATSGNPRDPLEGYNRAMFSFNDAVDKAALKPAATIYQKLTPSFVQAAVGNFFGNLGDVWTAANNLLQGKVGEAATDVTRVAMNSTFGLVGLIDIASEAGLPKHKEDLGQTLGKWGIGSGPYLVLPLLGPSTLRDTVALPVDIAADPWGKVSPKRTRYIGTALRIVDQRAGLLEAGVLLEDAALDRYAFVRDGFLQRRENKVFDGEIPQPRRSSDDSAEPAPTASTEAIAPSAGEEATSLVAQTELAVAAVSSEELSARAAVIEPSQKNSNFLVRNFARGGLISREAEK